MANLSLQTANDGNSASLKFGGVEVLTVTENTVSTNGLLMTKSLITTDSTIPNGYNAMSAGPITIDDTVQVIIGDSSRWVIV